MEAILGRQIDWDECLWRYFKVERLETLLNRRKLYFAAANQFSEPFEGAVAVQTDLSQKDPRYAEMEPIENAFFNLKRLVKINCWHRAEYESDAMWKLYADEGKGVAVCSTPDRMKTAIVPFRLQPEFGVEKLWCSPIEYVDLTKIRMNAGMLEQFFYKHRAFEWEKEFRLSISLRMAEEFGVYVPEGGIEVDVDLDKLIDRIVIGPKTSKDERARVSQIISVSKLERKLEVSSLLGQPRFI